MTYAARNRVTHIEIAVTKGKLLMLIGSLTVSQRETALSANATTVVCPN